MAETIINYFAQTDFRGKRIPFGIKGDDRARHVYVIGKTGMGKSCLLENMAVQDIQNGEGMAFIDPHGKSAELLLDFVPPERLKDVIYFAPFDLEHPISFNVMEDVGPDQRHLVANGLMSSFKKIWPDVWSSRMEYILNNCLLALLEYPDSTLLGVNRLLSDKDYRKQVVDNITDPSVRSFWLDEFAKYNERYMQEAGDAIKNKIGQFTANPLIRNIIGQTKSSFDLREAMDSKKILIVNLSKGQLGEQNANLLGGILITKIYLAAMSRAGVGAGISKLPYFYVFIDEFQSFVNDSFADILSEARKYKLSLTIAHQYIEQMPEEVRNAVFGNIGTTIAFRVGPFDAEVLEKIFLPTFTQEDLVNLGFAQIYLTLMINGVGSPPFSAVTLPPIVSTTASIKDQIIKSSQKNYASPRELVETKITTWFEPVVKFTAKSEPKKSENSKTPQTFQSSLPLAKTTKAVSKPVATPVTKSAPKPLAKPAPPKAFSLSILKNKAQSSNPSTPLGASKNKDELKAFLGEIMANKKPKTVSASSTSNPSVRSNSQPDPKKEIPQDVLEDLLAVKPGE
ncbi:MAG: type IV secretion system DNA-binding domain-containing protein [Candidatus Paceibacterota bacterium]|jgi:hypothetical protein